jgi:hypothetical protein
MGLVVLSDADDDEAMTLHLPDGSAHIVRLDPDNEEALRITSEIRQLIERVEIAPSRRRRGSGPAVAD